MGYSFDPLTGDLRRPGAPASPAPPPCTFRASLRRAIVDGARENAAAMLERVDDVAVLSALERVVRVFDPSTETGRLMEPIVADVGAVVVPLLVRGLRGVEELARAGVHRAAWLRGGVLMARHAAYAFAGRRAPVARSERA